MKTLQRIELLKDFVQQAVDRGATSVEAIHQHIAALPFDMLDKSGLLDDGKLRLKDKQQRTIGAVYDAIRRVNQQVGQLISDQFELAEDSRHIARIIEEVTKKPASAAKRAPVKRAATPKAAKKAAAKKAPKKAARKAARPRAKG
ncbi:MAG: hypothetical protein ACREVL_07265 [Solimonas sp.]